MGRLGPHWRRRGPMLRTAPTDQPDGTPTGPADPPAPDLPDPSAVDTVPAADAKPEGVSRQEWDAFRQEIRDELAKVAKAKAAPAPAPKPKPDPPAGPAPAPAPADDDEAPSYGSRAWFAPRKKKPKKTD